MSYFQSAIAGKWVGEGDLAQTLRELAQQLTAHLDPSAFPPGFPYPGCTSLGPCPLPISDAVSAAALGAGAPALERVYSAAQQLLRDQQLPANRRRVLVILPGGVFVGRRRAGGRWSRRRGGRSVRLVG